MAATSLTANAYANTSGHRQPGETCAREAARPGSQGTKAVHGTWCSEGEAGRHLRTKAGYGPETPSPAPVPLRLERIATQAQQYPDMAFTTLAHPGCGDAGTGVWESQPAQCPWGGPGHMADVQGQPGNTPGGITRKTRQWNVLAATGCSPIDPQKQRQAATARASGPGGQNRGQGRGDAAGGDLRAGFLRLLLRFSPRPQPASRPA